MKIVLSISSIDSVWLSLWYRRQRKKLFNNRDTSARTVRLLSSPMMVTRMHIASPKMKDDGKDD